MLYHGDTTRGSEHYRNPKGTHSSSEATVVLTSTPVLPASSECPQLASLLFPASLGNKTRHANMDTQLLLGGIGQVTKDCEGASRSCASAL